MEYFPQGTMSRVAQLVGTQKIFFFILCFANSYLLLGQNCFRKEEKKSAKLSVSVFYWSQLDRGSREITFMLGMQHFPVLSPLQHVRLSL